MSETPLESIVPCSGCGTTEPADSGGLCPTPTCRRFRKGNQTARIHGTRAAPTPEDHARREQLHADVDADVTGTLLREAKRDYATKRALVSQLAAYLADVGPLTKAGRRRPAVETLRELSASTERTAALIAELEAKRTATQAETHGDLATLTTEELAARLRASLALLEGRPVPAAAAAAPVAPAPTVPMPVPAVAALPMPATPPAAAASDLTDEDRAALRAVREADPEWKARQRQNAETPEARRKREEAVATKTMLHTMFKPSPWL